MEDKRVVSTQEIVCAFSYLPTILARFQGRT
jgi:hypothetical protein